MTTVMNEFGTVRVGMRERNGMKTVRVATWNILGGTRGYGARLPRIMDEMAGRGVDAIAFQEVRLDHADMLSDLLDERGYRCAILRGTGDDPVRGTDMEPVSEDTVTIAWNRSMERAGDAVAGPEGQMLSMDLAVEGGGTLTMISYHGMRGCTRQAVRMREVSCLDTMAQEGTDVHATVVGGDFNTGPGELPIRYMKGRDPGLDGGWTFWIDAQEAITSVGGGREKATTVRRATGADTGPGVGIDPAFMPERVIDHIMTRGYRYGRPGGFVSASVIDTDRTLSDHRPVVADIIAPVRPS